jgi:hypothetical protein
MGQATSDTSSRTSNVSSNQPTTSQNQNVNTNLHEQNAYQEVNYNQPRYNYTGGINYNPNYINQSQQNQSVQSNQFQNQPLVNKSKGVINMNNLREAFRLFAVDGKYLTQQKFNDTIEKLFARFDIPSMHYTYLSDKIYILLDESRDGKISEDEFLKGMKGVLIDKNFRMKCMFCI